VRKSLPSCEKRPHFPFNRRPPERLPLSESAKHTVPYRLTVRAFCDSASVSQIAFYAWPRRLRNHPAHCDGPLLRESGKEAAARKDNLSLRTAAAFLLCACSPYARAGDAFLIGLT
jgi:hypothetical protein